MTTFGLLVPAVDDDARRTVESLLRQDDPDWTVVLATYGSVPSWCSNLGPRVVALRVPLPDGPDRRASLLDAARAACRADWVATLGPGDELEPGALAAFRLVLTASPNADVVYGDEQWSGRAEEEIPAKPDFLPTLLESYPYVGRPAFLRSPVLEAAGGFVRGTALAEEHDALLRVVARTQEVAHVPAVTLTRARPPAKDAPAHDAVVRAVERQLARTGRRGRVVRAEVPLGVRVSLEVDEPPLVSVAVPTAGGRRQIDGREVLLVEQCLEGLAQRTTYRHWEVVLVTSEGTPPDVVSRTRDLVGDRLTVAPVGGAFNFSTSVNEGVRASRGELILLLNDDTSVLEPDWLTRMVGVAADPTVGVVGAKLLFGDGTIQHVGITFSDARVAAHALIFEPDSGAGPWGMKVLDGDWSAVTGACLLTPRAVYEEVGGFSETLPLNFNDVDYCLKVRPQGVGSSAPRRLGCGTTNPAPAATASTSGRSRCSPGGGTPRSLRTPTWSSAAAYESAPPLQTPSDLGPHGRGAATA